MRQGKFQMMLSLLETNLQHVDMATTFAYMLYSCIMKVIETLQLPAMC